MRFFSTILARKPRQCCRNCFPSVTEILLKNRVFLEKQAFILLFSDLAQKLSGCLPIKSQQGCSNCNLRVDQNLLRNLCF